MLYHYNLESGSNLKPRCGPRAKMMILLSVFNVFLNKQKYSKRPKMRSKSKNGDFA